tara:strand:- start:90 stop:932 length:843 start_codon:yes stop_codon:yes gene_type:complete
MYSGLALIPLRVLYFFSIIGSFFLYYIARYRRSIVRENLTNAFPELSITEIKDLEKDFYKHLCRVAMEVVKAKRLPKSEFIDRVKVRNPELIKEISENYTRSVIVLTIHQGNWEWMLHGVTLALGIPIDGVYKPLKNKPADDLAYTIRSRFGARPLKVDDSTKDIIKRRKEFRLFAMVAEQSPSKKSRSIWLPFFNREVPFYIGSEVIAKMTNFAVVFAQCHKKDVGYYEIEFLEIARPPYDKSSNFITKEYVRLAERAILNDPSSWLWSNRRWKHAKLQ